MRGDLASRIVGNPYEFVGGKDKDINAKNIKTLQEILKENCPSSVEFKEGSLKHMDELDHLLLFYKEESLIHIDENLVTAELFAKRYYDCEKFLITQRDSPSRTIHIHRRGNSYFDVWIVIRRERATKLMQIALEIFSTKDENGNWKDSEVFTEMRRNKFVLRFRLPDGADVNITSDATGIERLAQNRSSFEYFENLIMEKTKGIGKEGFIVRVNNLANWVEKDATRRGNPDPIGEANKKRDEYLNENNPDRLILVFFPKERENE